MKKVTDLRKHGGRRKFFFVCLFLNIFDFYSTERIDWSKKRGKQESTHTDYNHIISAKIIYANHYTYFKSSFISMYMMILNGKG